MAHPRSEMAPGVVAFPRRADPVETEQAIEKIALTLRKRPKEVQIDLQGVKFFEPYGITATGINKIIPTKTPFVPLAELPIDAATSPVKISKSWLSTLDS